MVLVGLDGAAHHAPHHGLPPRTVGRLPAGPRGGDAPSGGAGPSGAVRRWRAPARAGLARLPGATRHSLRLGTRYRAARCAARPGAVRRGDRRCQHARHAHGVDAGARAPVASRAPDRGVELQRRNRRDPGARTRGGRLPGPAAEPAPAAGAADRAPASGPRHVGAELAGRARTARRRLVRRWLAARHRSAAPAAWRSIGGTDRVAGPVAAVSRPSRRSSGAAGRIARLQLPRRVRHPRAHDRRLRASPAPSPGRGRCDRNRASRRCGGAASCCMPNRRRCRRRPATTARRLPPLT